jgi:hypothetical protein
MAIMDARLEFCDATTLVGAVATTVRGNTIDLGAARTFNDADRNADIGDGTPIYMHVAIGTAIATTANTGSATLSFVLQEANTNTPASFATAFVLSPATARATHVAGYNVYDGALPSRPYKRYLRLATAIATSSLTAGTVDAFLSLDPVN